jgi:hypothetical protein
MSSLAADMGLADHLIVGLIAGGKDGSNEFQIAHLLVDSK